MKAYADTGFLVSANSNDANSHAAQARMMIQPLPLAWTWLHDLEFRNALRMRMFRKQSTGAECERILKDLSSDLQSGVYLMAPLSPQALSLEAERLSVLHTETLGCRSLDILHVAGALVLGSREFLTFDRRQGALAAAAGLRVPAL